MGNLWPYKNHHYSSKYLIVLLQKHCEKIQFKSGHPVYQNENKFHRISDIAVLTPLRAKLLYSV